MKNKFKIFLAFVLGLIVAGTIGVFATIAASSITYNNTTVDLALDDLYSKVNSTGDKTCLYLEGTKNTVGAKYGCNLGDGEIRYFYLLADNPSNNTVELIMDRNIDSNTYTWNDAINYFSAGTGLNIKNSWTKVSNVSLPSIQDIANAVGNTSWDATTATANDWFFYDKYNDTYGQTQVANSNNKSAYSWLCNNLRECATFGCDISLSTGGYGYWSNDKISDDSASAWQLTRAAKIEASTLSYSSYSGVRPVITISKSQLSN